MTQRGRDEPTTQESADIAEAEKNARRDDDDAGRDRPPPDQGSSSDASP